MESCFDTSDLFDFDPVLSEDSSNNSNTTTTSGENENTILDSSIPPLPPPLLTNNISSWNSTYPTLLQTDLFSMDYLSTNFLQGTHYPIATAMPNYTLPLVPNLNHSPPIPSPISSLPVVSTNSDESSSIDGDVEETGTARKRRLKGKRSKESEQLSDEAGSVTLSRDQLLSFTSDQFEDFVSTLGTGRELNSGEKSEIKRQRRLIKNRESAQASRQRKKLHMDQLEKKVKELSSENNALKENIASLCCENNQLKQHVALLNEVVKKSMAGADIFSRGYNFLNAVNPKQYFTTAPFNGTGLVLMIVLFSFGLLFSNWITPTTPAFPITHVVEPLPPILSPRIFAHEDFEFSSHSDNPLTVYQQQNIPTERLEKSYGQISYLPRPAIADKSQPDVSTSLIPIESQREGFSEEIEESPSTAIIQSYQSRFSNLISEDPFLSLKTEPCLPQIENPPRHNDTVMRPDISMWKSNTTYLLCGSVSQIHPSPNSFIEDYTDERKESYINILIPPDESNPDKTFLSVTCKILETSFIPILSKSLLI